MGIFSLFGKKRARTGKNSSGKSDARKSRDSNDNTVFGADPDLEEFSHSIMVQRHIARATERKIDAIEFEMSRDIVKTRPTPAKTTIAVQTTQTIEPKTGMEFESTLPLMLQSTDLLGQHTDIMLTPAMQSESVPVLEEAAILYANGQIQMAEQMLLSAIHHQNLGSAEQLTWHMLFDLYRVTRNQHQFESLSLDFANKFETSPPLWPAEPESKDNEPEQDNTTPSLHFPAKLDGGIVKLLEKMQELGKQSHSLCLNFSRVKEVSPVGCGLLLRGLKGLKKSGHDLVLVSAQEFAEKIRAILQVGRRDETEAPWLLLLEILQLLHFEKAFEEASMDYCVTFEVSPPAFQAPEVHVTSSFPEITMTDEPSDRYMMPAIIKGKTDQLLREIAEHAAHFNPVILDCSRLEMVEFSASAQLLSGLAPIAAQKGVSICFEDVNYLVMMLFNSMGLKNVASITPHKL